MADGSDPLEDRPRRFPGPAFWSGLESLLSAVGLGSPRTLLYLGGLYAPSVVNGAQLWRLWTYQFLHGGAVHIFFNLYALLSLGPATEDVYGPVWPSALDWSTRVGAGGFSLGTPLFFC